MTVKERIIVLRTIKHGEADMIVHGLNPLGARLNLYARGACKSRKRFSGGLLEPTHYLEISYKLRSGGDDESLHTLLEAQMLREFSGLRTDYSRLDLGLYMLRLVHKLSQQGVVDAGEMFNLLGNGLAAAEESADLTKLRLHFEVKLLAVQGVLPSEERYQPWLRRPLVEHMQIPLSGRDLYTHVHDHLRQYLGNI